MLTKTRILSIVICVSALSACTTDNPDAYTNYQPSHYMYSSYTYGSNIQPYPQMYENVNYSETPLEQKPVDVPDTYHVGVNHTPTPHTDVDREWVNGQNAQSYTIQLGDGDKASQVAGVLFKAPKNERTAEVQYQHDGKTYYKGLYGTYPNYEAAQKALSALPEDVKQKAGIKSWSSVQGGTQ